jgi:hypothetical protein
VQRQEALASLEVARAELDKVQQQLALAQSAADKKGQEVRELNHMLKAWEAMRLGKDAQVRHGAGAWRWWAAGMLMRRWWGSRGIAVVLLCTGFFAGV